MNKLQRAKRPRGALNPESHDNDEGQVPLTQASATKDLNEVGVQVGPKTSRNRLLELLDRHVKRKKWRGQDHTAGSIRSSQSTRGREQRDRVVVPSFTTVPVTAPPESSAEADVIPDAEAVPETNVDFSMFSNSQLSELLRTVGVDTSRMDRAALVDQCKNYRELLIIPQHFYEDVQKENPFAMTTSEFTMQVPLGGVQDSTSIANPTMPEVTGSSIKDSTSRFNTLSSTHSGKCDLQMHAEDPQRTEGCPTSIGVIKDSTLRVDPSSSTIRKSKLQLNEEELESPEGCTASTGVIPLVQEELDQEQTSIPKRRTSRRSTRPAKSLPLAHQPPITASSKGSTSKLPSNPSTSKPSSEASTSQKSHTARKNRAREIPANSSPPRVSSLKGKGVDRREVTVDKEIPTPGLINRGMKARNRASSTASNAAEDCVSTGPQSPGPSTLPLESTAQGPASSSSRSNKLTTFLPSLEHGWLAYPRPRPTLRQATSHSKNTKAQNTSSVSEWEPEDTPEDRSTQPSEKHSNRQESQSRDQDPACNPKHSNRQESQSHDEDPACDPFNKPSPFPDSPRMPSTKDWTIPKLRKKVAEDSLSIQHLQIQTCKLTDQVETLTNEVRALSRMVSSMKKDAAESPKKIRRGRIASQMRFHIDTLLGMPPHETQLPLPASDKEKSSWMCDIEIPSNSDIDSSPPSPTGHRANIDPCFPYENGPGHVDSTPQQLAVMWRMMKSVGVSSFRPDFSESPNSQDNKWLWNLAMEIFLKLVQCGEYAGVPLEVEDSDQVQRCLNTYVVSLTKRYRQQHWDTQRKRKGADETRRKARTRHLKSLRDEIVLSKEGLFCLSSIIEMACSDNESDPEAESPTKTLRPAVPCRIRKLPWRSSQLEDIFVTLDRYKDAPISPIKPPPELPSDCYSREWLANLSPRELSTLDIVSTPLLPRVIAHVKALI